ncbi:MAG: hypothetical protein WBE75_06640 [Candidatus Omnitrophota bacterium]
MYYLMRMGIIVVAALSLTGCCRVFPSSPWCPAVPVTVSNSEIAARMEVKRNRENAEALVSEIKEAFKGKEAEKAYLNSRKLYTKAMSENNTWLSTLTSSIVLNENLEGVSPYENQTKIAADAAKSFLTAGEEALSGQSRNASIKSLVVIGDLITSLVNSGITIWKENKNLQDEDRKKKAEILKKELQWGTWTEIK